MHESVTYRINGNEESYSSCKVKNVCDNNDYKHKKKLWLILVPAAAVIPEQQALFIIIECIGYVD